MGSRRGLGLPILPDVVPGFGGQLGVAACPGVAAGDARQFACRRGLERDIDAIRAWGAVAVVTLLDDLAMLAAGVGVLPAALAARGIEWHHLPAGSGPAGSQRVECLWRAMRLRLRAHLASGGNVLIHGGPDLVEARRRAARLVADLGATTGVGAAGELARGDEWWRRHDRIAGCLLGGLLGDAISRAIRFRPLDETPLIDTGGSLASGVLKGGRLMVDGATMTILESLVALPDTALAPEDVSSHRGRAVLDAALPPALAGALQGIGVFGGATAGAKSPTAIHAGSATSRAVAAMVEPLVAGATVESAIDLAAGSIRDAGLAVSALGVALEFVRAVTTFVESMSLAAGLGAEAADTVRLVGCIQGAAVGLAAIPHDWSARLDAFDTLTVVLSRL